jgi:hypothetical protein
VRRGVVAAGAAGGGLVGDVVVVDAGREAVMGAGAVVAIYLRPIPHSLGEWLFFPLDWAVGVDPRSSSR